MARRFNKNTEAEGDDADGQEAPPAVVTDEIIAKHAKVCAKAKKELDEARDAAREVNGTYRAALKAAKQAGVTPDDITWYIAIKARDLDEVNAELERRARIARVMQLPLNMRDPVSGLTIADMIERTQAEKGRKNGARGNGHDKPDTKASLDKAEKEGKLAAAQGKLKEDCPYEEGAPKRARWLKGWGEQTRTTILGTGNGAETAGAAAH